MLAFLKKKLYFTVAAYFRFWAKLVLRRWQPKIWAVLGSGGKTTLVKLLAELLERADQERRVSWRGNSAYGIPFDILHLKPPASLLDWLIIACLAPWKALTIKEQARFYLCELDADRPGEMRFLTGLIEPEVIFWLSSFTTHSDLFDPLIGQKFPDVEDAIAYEFGFALERTKKFAFLNADSPRILRQLPRTQAQTLLVREGDEDETKETSDLIFSDYQVGPAGSSFLLRLNPTKFNSLRAANSPFLWPESSKIELPQLVLPRHFGYTLAMAAGAALLLGISESVFSQILKNFKLPPGRLSLLSGLKGTRIIDSSYNASRLATEGALEVLARFPGQKRALLGDMRELGQETEREHRALAQKIKELEIERIILVGPAMVSFTQPALLELGFTRESIQSFLSPVEARDFLLKNLREGETILVKGSQNTLFLEGIVESLLADPRDRELLCRRGEAWERKRKALGY